MFCKRHLSYSQRFQEFLKKNLTGMGWNTVLW